MNINVDLRVGVQFTELPQESNSTKQSAYQIKS